MHKKKIKIALQIVSNVDESVITEAQVKPITTLISIKLGSNDFGSEKNWRVLIVTSWNQR